MKEWPLHVTLVGPFAVSDVTQCYNQLRTISNNTYSLELIAGNNTQLGTANVVLVNMTDDLLELHTAIVNMLNKEQAVISSPEHQLQGYIPHCTVQESAQINTGDSFVLNNLSLIDMFPGGDWRKRLLLKNFIFDSAA